MCYSYSNSSNILENLRIHKHTFQLSSAVVPSHLRSVLKTPVAWFLPPDILIELAGYGLDIGRIKSIDWP